MGKSAKKRPVAAGRASLKAPLNPSIRGTAKQAARTEKGGRSGAAGYAEGRGHAPGGGRGGKTSRH